MGKSKWDVANVAVGAMYLCIVIGIIVSLVSLSFYVNYATEESKIAKEVDIKPEIRYGRKHFIII